jgi:hypothetical protein
MDIENVLLQGYAVTGAVAGDQALITQGYASGAAVVSLLIIVAPAGYADRVSVTIRGDGSTFSGGTA